MNRRNRASSSHLFLLELIIAILFFSIASAACVQIFVRSHVLSQDAQALNMAVSECTGAAEIVRSCDDPGEAADIFTGLYSEAVVGEDGESITVYYDSELQPSGSENAAYEMTVQLAESGGMLAAEIEMTHGDANIYVLHVDSYKGEVNNG